MPPAPDSRPLLAAIDGLRSLGIVPRVAGRLDAGRDAFVAGLLEAILDEVPGYRESANPEVLPGLRSHLDAQAAALCRLLAGSRPDDFAFVSGYAEIRARQRFPLEALLQAYRVLHRQLIEWLRDAAIEAADDSAQLRRVVAAVTDFTIDYTGLVGTLLTSNYVEHTRLVAEAEGDRRAALLNTLLDGYDEADAHAARLLRGAGYLAQRQSYCVAVARSVNPREMESAARAQRMVDALAHCLSTAPFRVIAGVRDNHVYTVVSATRRLSGWTAPQSLLADRIFPLLRTVGTAALIGVSNDVPSTAHIPRAAAEARLALEQASVADRVVVFAGIPFAKVLVSGAGQTVRSAFPPWLDAFLTADGHAGGALSTTLEAYADADMNVLRAAKALSIHPNTVYARMQKIEAITGRKPLEYRSLTDMLLVLDCAGH